MTGIILGIVTVVLIIVCAFITLIVLMQRASSNAGLGASLGGGAAESALGGGASNVLVKGTIIGAILFFVLSFGLYLGHMANYENALAQEDGGALPTLESLPEVEKPTLPALPDAENAPEPTNGTGTSEVDVAPPAGNTMLGTGDDAATVEEADNSIDPSLLDNPDQDGLPQSQDSFLSVPELPTSSNGEGSMFDQPATETPDSSGSSE
ncbi:MAG: preprotein translocase subunit SecG [Verrucomicrobiota bacterium]